MTTYERIHKAVPNADEQHCAVCGQYVKRVPGGHGSTWVHRDSGAVVAPNPSPSADVDMLPQFDGDDGDVVTVRMSISQLMTIASALDGYSNSLAPEEATELVWGWSDWIYAEVVRLRNEKKIP